MPRFVLLLAALVISPLMLSAQHRCAPGVGRTVLIHGVGHAFTVTAPHGWLAQAGAPDQIAPAILFPDGDTWRDAPVVMYVNTVLPDSGRPASLPAVMRADSIRFRTEYPAMRMETLPATRTADGRLVRFRKFVGGGYGSIDVVGYVAEQTVTPLLVMSARTEADAARTFGAFRALLQSYHYLTTAAARGSRLPCGAA